MTKMPIAGGGRSPAPSSNPHQSYLVCFTARTGSTLLCDALESTGLAGRPEEYFNPTDLRVGARAAIHEPVWEEDKRALPFPEYLQRVFAYGTTPNGVFASKLSIADLGLFIQRMRDVPDAWPLSPVRQLAAILPEPKYIWVTRRDKVRQAISVARAMQTDVWIQKSGISQQTEVEFKLGGVTFWLHEIIHEEANWSQFFEEGGVIPFTVVYEDLTRDYEGTARRALDFLGIEVPESFTFPTPRLHKQADAITEEWVQRYYEEGKRAMARREMVRRPLRRGVEIARTGVRAVRERAR